MIRGVLKVGLGSCGIAAGALEVYDYFLSDAVKKNLGNILSFGEQRITIGKTSCIGLCFAEPLVEFCTDDIKILYGRVDKIFAEKIVNGILSNTLPLENRILEDEEVKKYIGPQVKLALKNCGIIDPENIEDYIERKGYSALQKAVFEMSDREVIEVIKESGLRGRGGAGFLTGQKWEFLLQAAGEKKYLVCNADEGDPGAFMDRAILEGDPHSVIEGMAIAAKATGAQLGYIYCRAEYPLAIKRTVKAINDAREKNFLGKNILGTDFSFDIILKEGAGAFVCGEETALIMSIHDRRGMPNLRPPFPAEKGINDSPTNINNVETYANVSGIVANGAESFNKYKSGNSTGTKVFALAGKVKRVGLVEVPMGLTIREVVQEIGGGSSTKYPLKAVQIGGPAGGCIPEKLFDTPINYDSINATGAIMGSGGLIVMDTNSCMVDVARYFLQFTQNESCGKCTFCRIGTKRMFEILQRITEGKGDENDISLLEELSNHVRKTSLCGLGQLAPNPVLTTLKFFKGEYMAHVKEKKCPAGVCRALIKVLINPEQCTGCTACTKVCPVNAISGEKKKPHVIDAKLCTKCGICIQKCKFDAIYKN
ncbi:MAG: NADH-quinone oxidoreductase subunit NuoF [Spirochaetes bacterium]|nr:NADH-quinone oxidoreductase subunit NuoF [Spirochaetota bacterium]